MAPSRTAALVGVLLAFCLTSCGDDPDESDDPLRSSSQAASPTGQPTSEPTSAEPTDQPTTDVSTDPTAAAAEETLRKFLTAYQSGNAKLVCEMSHPAYADAVVETSSGQSGLPKNPTCEDVYRWAHGLIASDPSFLQPHGLTVTVKGDKATAPATYDGQKFTYFLTYVDGRWLVSGDSDEGYFGD